MKIERGMEKKKKSVRDIERYKESRDRDMTIGKHEKRRSL